MSSSLQWSINQPNFSRKKLWKYYHVEMSSTWHWYHQNYHLISSSLWNSNCPPVAGKLCSVCKNTFRSRYADLPYHWAELSCDNVCHLAATCSGFINPRGPTRTRILSSRIWHCHLHSSSIASGYPSTQPDTSPERPTLLSINSLLNQGMSLADA